MGEKLNSGLMEAFLDALKLHIRILATVSKEKEIVCSLEE
jgi:hypothetical protein